ncbi:attachment p12 family protein [Mobilisporobacter senegalensis]|uniref:Attachment p12 family protein n=1 Tax=Mobilisporobacter senegalensis TaxID=1329262 RepID=A0A3N1XL78_9FIRM|nr:FeoB-associated Cys-rich membrane protein [Mobilisporobacter senegalensis]ROR27465.1 attachment p12 family protein [Mobilisporobacter senegalensis]
MIDIIVVGIIVLCLGGVIYYNISRKKKGETGCSGCSGCSHSTVSSCPSSKEQNGTGKSL